MNLRRTLPLLLLLFGLPAAARAQGIACGQARTAVERAICASPELRVLDAAVAADYRGVQAATHGATRRALHAQQRAWLRARDTACAAGAVACLSEQYVVRRDALRALAARISRGNPELANVTSVALLGAWKVDGYRALHGAPPPDLAGKPASLPAPGTTLIGRPGELCDETDACLPFGLDPQSLADDTDGQRLADGLHLPPGAPMYMAYFSGKSEFALIPAPDGTLLAEFDACDRTLTDCQVTFQVWRPASSDASIRVLAH